MNADWQNVLDEWERVLHDLLPGVTLLGELGLSIDDRDEIAAALHAGISELGPAAFTHKAEASWPLALAAYLVTEGIFDYRKGAFWSAVCERTGLPHANYPMRWGRVFERALELAGKPTFTALVQQEHATRYVARILAHGGVPDSCLPHLFARVLAPATRRRVIPQADELLEDWRTQSWPLRGVDRPVRRFLMEGGEVARDFLDRCLELAQRAKADGKVPHANQVGLPERVVAQYRAWREDRRSRPRRPRAPGTPRPAPVRRPRPPRPRRAPRPASVRQRSAESFVAPYLALEPWGGTVLIRLPAQRLTTLPAAPQVRWTIFDGTEERAISRTLWRRGKEWQCDAAEFPVERVAHEYRVSLAVGDGVVKQSSLRGLSDDVPILAFRTGGRMRAWTGGIPATEVWMLLPQETELAAVPAGSAQGVPLPPLEVGQPLWGDWDTFKIIRVDLHDRAALDLHCPGHEPIRLSLLTPPREPTLAGAPVLAGEEEDDAPLFAAPPAVRIPLDPLQPAAKQIERYSLTLRHAGKTARSTTSRAVSLAELRAVAVDGADSVEVPLTGLVDASTAGEFELVVRLGLGRDTTLRFALLPGLEIHSLDRTVLPSPAGRPQPASVRVRCPAAGRLLADVEGVTVQREPATSGGDLVWWRIEGAAELDALPLRFDGRDERGGRHGVAFRVPIQRLRWRLEGLEAGSTEGTSPRFTRDDFVGAVNPHLTIHSPPVADLAGLRLALLAPSGEERQLLPAPRGWRPGQGHELRFDLAAFRDTIRHARDPELTLALDAWLGAVAAPPTRFSVLSVECPPLPDVQEPKREAMATAHLPDMPDASPGAPEAPGRQLTGASPPPGRPAAPVAAPPTADHEKPVAGSRELPTAPAPQAPVTDPAPEQAPPEARPPAPAEEQRLSLGRPTPTARRPRWPVVAPVQAKLIWSPPPDHLIGKRYANVPRPKRLRPLRLSERGPLYICVGQAVYAPACHLCLPDAQSNRAWRSVHNPALVVFDCEHKVWVEDMRVGRRLKP